MSKKAFRINYMQHMAECDMNYLRLIRLLPELSQRDHYRFAVCLPAQHSAEIDIQVIERSPYTTTLRFERSGGHKLLKAKALTVRIYADAQIAEVLACESGKQLRAKYHYPNQHMYQQDEKVQINRFLGEWLNYCLDFGHSLESVLQTC